jgi:hypothetical protein
MKRLSILAVLMAIGQAAAMYLFLRIIELGFFTSAALAACVALVIGLGVYLIQLRSGPRRII